MPLTDLLIDGPQDAGTCVILAHGAGAGMDTPFMNTIAQGLAAQGILCVRFEFPYMARRRAEGTRRPPDRAPVLLSCWADVVAEVRRRFAPRHLVIGGKSMGGRMATLCAADLGVNGVVALGYPFHPAGKPGWSETRLGHLSTLPVPTLICQGERDTLGGRAYAEGVVMSPQVRVFWLPDGDHSLKPRKSSGHTADENLSLAVAEIAAFVRQGERA